MTANELADELQYHRFCTRTNRTAAIMLRKQQAEIEALKLRELNDKEIESAYWSLVGKQHEGKIASYLYNFARDILKKASEK